jgi:hypothetical protein
MTLIIEKMKPFIVILLLYSQLYMIKSFIFCGKEHVFIVYPINFFLLTIHPVAV